MVENGVRARGCSAAAGLGPLGFCWRLSACTRLLLPQVPVLLDLRPCAIRSLRVCRWCALYPLVALPPAPPQQTPLTARAPTCSAAAGTYLSLKLSSLSSRLWLAAQAFKTVMYNEAQYGQYASHEEVMEAGNTCSICQVWAPPRVRLVRVRAVNCPSPCASFSA